MVTLHMQNLQFTIITCILTTKVSSSISLVCLFGGLLAIFVIFIIIYSVANKSDNDDDCRIGVITASFK